MKSYYFLLLLFLFIKSSLWAQAPVISGFTPSSGAIGTSLTVTGSNFSSIPEENIVYFGPVKAVVSASSSSELTVTIPAGGGSEKISVTVNGLTGVSNIPFFIPFESNRIIDGSAFAPKVDFTTGTEPQRLALGDLDSDGKIDVVVVNYQSNTISVFKNNSTAENFTSSSLQANIDFSTGENPFSVVVEDLDGDGNKDIVVSNYTSNTISIFRNKGTTGSISSTSFEAKVDFSTGNNPQKVCVGDLDGDGKPEIAVTNATSNTVSVFRNISSVGSITSGSFESKVDFGTGSFPWGVAFGDLDGDNKPEIVVTNGTSHTVSIYKNITTTGSITSSSFSSKQDFATSEGPVSVVIADFDQDGKSDLAVGCVETYTSGAQISVFRNTSTTGAISLTRQDVKPSGLPMFLVAADIDGDKKPELAVANEYQSNVSVLKNNSTSGTISLSLYFTSTMVSSQDYPTAGNSTGIAAGDMDGDGRTDLVAACPSTNSISVLRNIMEEQIVPIISSFTPEQGPIGTVVTITGTNFSSTPENNIVFFGTVRGKIESASATEINVKVPYGANDQFIKVQVNGLSSTTVKPFLVTYTTNTPIDIKAFGPEINLANSYKVGAIGDLDQDGKLDVVGFLGTGTDHCGSSYISVYRNNSTAGELTDSSFQERVDFALTGASCPGYAYYSKIADLDGDGKPEIIVFANYVESIGNTGNLFIFKNTSIPGEINSTSFAPPVHISTLYVGTPRGLEIADMDLDGKPDIIVSHLRKGDYGAPNGPGISILRNSTAKGVINSTSFTNPQEFIPSPSASAIKVGDLNGDNKPDIVVANGNENTISVFRNTSTFGKIDASSLASRQDFAASSYPLEIAIADFDGDGIADVAVSNYNSYSASIFRNTTISGQTTFSFATRQEYALGETDFQSPNQPQGIAAGDLDGDGKPDMILANSSGDKLSFFRNITASGASTLSFDAKVDMQSGLYPNQVQIEDFDGDGKNDLISNSYSSSLQIYRNTLQSPPTISSFSPKVGSVGSNVTIFGTDFIGATNVTFNNIEASEFTVNSSASITATIPEGATTGKISVTTALGTAVSEEDFVICTKPPKPTITVSYADPYIPRLTSSAETGNQWFKNSELIPGATEKTYDVTENASYQVQVTINGCSSLFSDEYNIITATETEQSPIVKIYPNPVKDHLMISGITGKIVNKEFIDISGRVITVNFQLTEDTATIDVSNLKRGVYYLKLQTRKSNILLKFLKD